MVQELSRTVFPQDREPSFANQIRFAGSLPERLMLLCRTGDGGGLGPVKVLQDIIEPEDGEEILILPNITGSVESADVLHDDSSEEEKHQQFKDKKALEGKQSEPEPERAILESQLDGAKREKAVLEERCKELTEKLESTEKAMVSQRVKNREKREKMQFQLEEQERLIKELQNKPGESGQKLEQPDLQKEEEKGVEKTEETTDVETVKSLQADSSIMQHIKESAVTGGVPRSTVEAVTNISSKAEKTRPVPGIGHKPEVVSTEDSGLQKKTKDLDVWKSDHGSKVSEDTADSDISKKYAKSETSRYDERLPLDDLSLVGSGTVDESVTDQKQTELGVTKSEQSTTATTTERTRENTKVAESNKAVTKVHDTVGYIARVTDGKEVTAMEGPMTRELTSRDSKLTGTKDTKDIFSRDTATDKDIGGKDGRKGISEAFGSSIDTRDSKVKEKKTFTRRILSTIQKLVSKFTISEKGKN
ncbi:enolase-phosphatase E1-like [Ptychodera flava]|uniref:enolase-phosphatase E1-like n=1 Tax=Ptychodera flava TaxID=63121 RepID=UPI00396A09F8